MDGGRRISDQTITAVSEVLREELDVTPYAWKIHDEAAERTWLSLSAFEAADGESKPDVRVSIVTWQLV